MAKFICRNCGFRVEKDKIEKCPYCDRKSLEKEKSAEELLSDIGEE
jgi:rubrerythrin